MISIHQGDILTAKVEAIVNPANSFLNHGGGLAAVIAKAAAPNVAKWPTRPHMWTDAERDWLNDNRDAPLIATGNTHTTSAGALPFRYVIHAVGPIWNGGGYMERPLLKLAHQNACARAYDAGCRSIAFPAISCGIFGFPVEEAARIAVEAIWSSGWADPQPDGLGMDVEFWLFEDAHYEAYREALARLA